MNRKKKVVLVYQYLGYNGGFAAKRILMWKAIVVGANGEEWRCDSDSWHGNPDRSYADDDARRWSEFTGWPIVDLGRLAARDDPLKD